jgi:hypothetical protein
VSRFFPRTIISAGALALALAVLSPVAPAQAVGSETLAPPATQPATQDEASIFTLQEVVAAGHRFFGTTTRGLAQAVEYVFSQAGRPSGYIIGEEAAGAFVGGLRYGEGTLYLKNGTRRKVFWQGPSVGFDFGGNGSRSLVLVYNISSPGEIFDRFVGVEGSAYVIGGLGVNFQSNERLKLAPIRTGFGARLGGNIGYLKYTSTPTWNPF